MKILLTAFEPFGGETVNPAFEAVNLLPGTIANAQIIKLRVPTVFKASIDTVTCSIDEIQPQVCLSVGLAGGRSDIAVERVAINVDDGRLPDNAGVQPVDQPIITGGPAAYFATLPIKAIVEGIRQQGIPASISNSAGTYVCNHLMYGVLHHISLHQLAVRAGFIHIPYLPSQVVDKPATPSMDLDLIVRALQAAVEEIVRS
jgi:pyroglutamyl-peptidase